MPKNNKARQAVLKDYKAKVSDLMEGRGVEKLYLGFLEDVEEAIISQLPFPQELRTMDQDDTVEEVHDIIHEELIRTYFKNALVQRINNG